MSPIEELILKHFKKPEGYKVSEKEWETALEECLEIGGCDWLQHLQDKWNPYPAQAIEDLCNKLEEAEEKLRSIDRAHEARKRLIENMDPDEFEEKLMGPTGLKGDPS